ncbi:MAG: Flp family type IVb pilin [Candidatus Riflebacteria bacterium]|nr:Flp family type IVb pilin [Candidatus Riflebacteria bacterium]
MPAFFVINLQKKETSMLRKNKKSGQGLVEYALIIGLIAIVAVAALSSVSGTLKDFYFDTIPNALNQIPNN